MVDCHFMEVTAVMLECHLPLLDVAGAELLLGYSYHLFPYQWGRS